MDQSGAPLILVAAGGTGGHLFPAEALAVALGKRGVTIDLATDHRATRYGRDFPARATHIIPSATFRKDNPLTFIGTPATLAFGTVRAAGLLKNLKPAAVVGFGGYPTIPPLMASALNRVPSILHEQNAVMGRANRLLAPLVTAIATSFPGVLDAYPRLARKATHTGNPVRPAVGDAAALPFDAPAAGGPLRLLIFGGSQGARILSDIVPPAIELVPMAVRARLSVVQQARDEDVARVQEIYARIGVPAEVAPFFTDLPARIAASHLVISRAGASTVAELAAIGRPGILVPLPHALDQDQRANAGVLEKAGGAICLDQSVFTSNRLAGEIAALAADTPRLADMAKSAGKAGTRDGAERLADLVLRVAGLKG